MIKNSMVIKTSLTQWIGSNTQKTDSTSVPVNKEYKQWTGTACTISQKLTCKNAGSSEYGKPFEGRKPSLQPSRQNNAGASEHCVPPPVKNCWCSLRHRSMTAWRKLLCSAVGGCELLLSSVNHKYLADSSAQGILYKHEQHVIFYHKVRKGDKMNLSLCLYRILHYPQGAGWYLSQFLPFHNNYTRLGKITTSLQACDCTESLTSTKFVCMLPSILNILIF